MKTIRVTNTIRLIATLAATGLACGAYAGPRAPIATPYGAVVSDYEPGTGNWHAPRGGVLDLQAAADFIVAEQCANGGWGWPVGGCPTTFNNITAPIGGGLLAAYPGTDDPAHLASAVMGGDFDLTFEYPNMTPRFGAFTSWFLNELSQASGDSMYADHVAMGFYGPLDAGTYGDTGSNWDTADWINVVQTSGGRDAQWINLRPWEFHLQITTAAELGTTAQSNLFLDALLDGLDTLDRSDPSMVFTDNIGLAGGVRGLALSGTMTFAPIVSPDHALINGIDNLTDLADVLAGLQNGNGSWYWHSNLASPTASDEDTQVTAYAVLALEAAQAAGAGDYSAEIALGRDWLGTMQDVDGGFFLYPGTTDKNTTVVAEATTALSSSSTLSLNTTMCEATGTLTVTIDMSDTAVDIVGGQLFLEYDTSALTFVSADPGTGDFDGEVFELVSGNQIDYAVGVSPFSDPGSNQAQTMATLTFSVNGENCTPVPALVSFRSSTPPSRLTDEVGNPVLPSLIDLNAVSFDQTAPVVSDPSDITLNADAGGCDALVTVPSLSASDNCGIDTIINDVTGTSDASGIYPVGPTTVTWTVTDTCGNTTVVDQVVTVNGVNDLAVDVELDQVSTNVDRCITFELTPAGGGTPVLVEETLSFTAGLASQTIEVPCGAYECITARDTLHTLQQRDDDDFGIVGTSYVADFTRTSMMDPGDVLRGGNYNDDEFIDILDFGIFIGQFGQMISADTPCPVTAPHADADGSGEVDTPDFTYISNQFLAQAEAACPGASPLTDDSGPIAIDAQRTGPVESITVAELADLGMAHLATADLNHDGVLDQFDIAAFFGGALPDHLADVTGDGVVDLLDMQFIAGAFQTGDLAGDINNDGRMDLADITFVIERVGMTFGG